MQPSDDLVIQIFFWTSAFLALVEAMKATGWRVWAFGALVAVLAVAGAAWGSVREVYPPFTAWMTNIATNPQSWFLLLLLALVLVAATGRVKKRNGSQNSNDFLQAELQSMRARIEKIEGLPEPVSAKDFADLKTTLLNLIKDQAGTLRKLPDATEPISQLNRTAFLLSVAYGNSIYRRRLLTQRSLIPWHPKDGPVDTDEKMLRQKALIDGFHSTLRTEMYGSRWLEEFDRGLRDAEVEADIEVRKMGRPEGIDPYIFRAFHIACIQRDRTAMLLEVAVGEAEAQEKQMLQMVRERPDLHSKR